MCPPAKSYPPDIDPNANNEQLILFLHKCIDDSNLPSNVLADLSPYHHPHSNLPEGIWYIVCSGEKKESVYGFWKVCEEPCEIYSNTDITGWKTTLEYFEGQTPHEQRTDWVMHAYSITRKELCGYDQTKDSRLLCRAFLCSGHSSKSETQPQNCKTVIESGEIDLLVPISPNINSPSSNDSWVRELEALIDADDSRTNSAPQNFCELDRILRGEDLELNDLLDPLSNRLPLLSDDYLEMELNDLVDPRNNRSPLLMDNYLELNDLVDPGSESSSSHSSCTSTLSDNYFDSLTLFGEVGEDKNKDIQFQSFAAPDRSNDVVSQPAAPTGSRPSDAGRIELVEAPQTGPTDTESLIDKTEPEQTTKRPKSDTSTEGTETTSSGDQGAGPSGEKKANSSRLKKLKIFLCFSF